MVAPVYGFGWHQKGSSINVPEPFEMTVEPSRSVAGEGYRSVIGRVISAGHPLHDKWALLTARTLGEDNSYNVRIYDEYTSEFPIDLEEAKIVVTGFASVRQHH
jgi:hypothetical protein